MAEPHRYLVVVAVEAEAKAIREGLARAAKRSFGPSDDWTVLVGGTGIAEAAVSTTAMLCQTPPFSTVFSAGIGGGFQKEDSTSFIAGEMVIGMRAVAAELGVETGERFMEWAELGFGTAHYDSNLKVVARCRNILGCRSGTIASVSTVTGTQARANSLLTRFPDVVAEAMEGFGVATAAARFGVPFVELRAISNPVGTRARDLWRIDEALQSLGAAFAKIGEGWSA